MNYLKTPWLRVALGVVLLAGLAGLSAADKKEKQEKASPEKSSFFLYQSNRPIIKSNVLRKNTLIR